MATAAPDVAWAPHPGSQRLFLSCPHWECMYTGTRGPGKTDALLMDFAQEVGKGYGADWRGVLFRHEYKPLAEIVRKSEKWFHRIFPEARFLRSQGEYRWIWPTGEELLLRAFKKAADYWDYHGHEYPWIAWEELTAWPSPDCYHLMKSCNRSSGDVPIRYRATCNPYGPGHNWVKAYFIDPAPPGVPFVADRSDSDMLEAEFGVDFSAGEDMQTVVLHGHYSENETLMAAQPNYPVNIAAAAANPEQAKAWLSDDWDIVAGGMFDDVWDRDRHVLVGFQPPSSWRIDRAFDWGSTKPFSVGWWAESDGTGGPFETRAGNYVHIPAGSLVRFWEWYGWDGKTPNVGLKLTDAEIGRGIVEREKDRGIAGRVRPGPADASIFDDLPGRTSIADELADQGVRFIPSDKSPGSVERGCEAMRRMLREAKKDRPEERGLWVTEECRQFIRTVPTLPRDDRKPDRYDTNAEDHIADEVRYKILTRAPKSGTVRMGVM